MDRYFLRGLIDGSLSSLGIVIGASTIGLAAPGATRVIIAAGLGGGVANGLSNVLGAFTAEKAIVYKRFEEIERAMLKDDALRDTEIGKKMRKNIMSSGAIDGVATTSGAIIPIAPFFLLSPLVALWTSISISLVLLFILGVYVGRISKENIVISGLKMAAFGAAAALIAALIRVLA